MNDRIILFVYGIFLILGGYFGYKKKGSKPSLYAGIVSGILVLIGGWLLDATHGAWIYLVGVTCGLTLMFLMRYMKTRAFMPAGMLLLISLGMLFFCISHLV